MAVKKKKKKEKKPSPIPHGSIVRTTWLDEEFGETSTYDLDVNESYDSPGIYALKTDALEHLFEKGRIDDECFYTIPHNTRGLMVIDHMWYKNSKPNKHWPEVWYHVIWKETSIWIHARHVVLVKKSTQ